MRKTVVDDKIANFEKLYKDETIKRKERMKLEAEREEKKLEANRRKNQKRRELVLVH